MKTASGPILISVDAPGSHRISGRLYVVLITAAAALGGLLFGYDTAGIGCCFCREYAFWSLPLGRLWLRLSRFSFSSELSAAWESVLPPLRAPSTSVSQRPPSRAGGWLRSTSWRSSSEC